MEVQNSGTCTHTYCDIHTYIHRQTMWWVESPASPRLASYCSRALACQSCRSTEEKVEGRTCNMTGCMGVWGSYIMEGAQLLVWCW